MNTPNNIAPPKVGAGDAGPVPDMLKREPPKPQVKRSLAEYNDLSVIELAKLINDEYAVILGNERTNYPRAISVGGKLVALRRGVDHGEWITKLKTHCKQISYETATKYIRLWKKQLLIEKAAAAKPVATTDLTIELALSLIAKPKQKTPTNGSGAVDGGDGKPTVEAMVAKQAANAEEEAAQNDDDDDNDVEGWFVQAVKAFSQDELRNLTERLAKHLGMTLTPVLPRPPAAAPTAPPLAQTQSAAAGGLRRPS